MRTHMEAVCVLHTLPTRHTHLVREQTALIHLSTLPKCFQTILACG